MMPRRLRPLLAPAAAACVLLGTTTAAAERPPAGGGKAPRYNADKYDWEWYGWQTLLVDAIAIPGAFVSFVADSDALAWASLGTYLAVPPILHGANGQWREGGASFVFRLVTPYLALAAVGGACSGDLECLFSAAGGGITAGMLAAATFDAAILTWKPLPGVLAPSP
jgi:hypothetical protein